MGKESILRNPTLRIQLDRDIQEVLRSKQDFYAATLGIKPGDKEYEKKLSYEPWTERAFFEREIRFVHDDLGKEALVESFKKEAELQMVTNLKERLNTEKNKTRFNIENGKFYSELLPTEPFEQILLRGLEAQKQAKSPEIEREEKEIEGFLTIQEVFGNPNAPLDLKIVLFCPPGVVKNTQYKKKFVDILELKEDLDGKRYVESTRFTTALNVDGYKDSALRLIPEFFTGFKESKLPIDAWFLSHPVVVEDRIDSAENIYDKFIEKDYSVMKEVQFQKVIKRCIPAIQYYVRELCRDVVDWQEVAVAFNAVLNIADDEVRQQEKMSIIEETYNYQRMPENILPFYGRKEISHWGRQEVRTVGGGCPGVSSGFNLENEGLEITYGFENLGEVMINSVGKFGLSEKKWFTCPKCGYQADGPVGDTCPKDKGGCGLTKEDYKKKGNKVC